MNSEEEKNYIVPLESTITKCCRCYVDYWKDIRNARESHFVFDYSIEKEKTFFFFFYKRKILLYRENVISFLCCTFKKAVFANQFLIVVVREYFMEGRFNKFLVSDGTCISGILRGNFDAKNICKGCVNFMIGRFNPDYMKTV